MLDNQLKRKIIITTDSNETKMEIGTKIHNQLRGNPDYVDSNIILNIDDDNTVLLLIYEEAVIPEITI